MVDNGAVEANLVAPGFACPSCGERRLDQLAWLEPDHELVRCATCGTKYTPGVDRRAWLIEAVVRIGLDIGWWDEDVTDEWRELVGTLTVEQLDRWYRVSIWAAKVKKEAGRKDETGQEGE